jgi:ribosomal protein L10
MSKYVKNLISEDLAKQLAGETDCLLVNVVGLDANNTMTLRRELRSKNIRITVVKNSLARRATEGTPLAVAFDSVAGPVAVVWGSEDIVSLAKEVVRLTKEEAYEGFSAKGGLMDQALLTEKQVHEVSKWPGRAEQLSILDGQILSPGANLSAQLLGPAGSLASQIKQCGTEE